MKILQLVPYFLPYNGGQEKYIFNLSQHLMRQGHEVQIITSNFPKSAKKEVVDGIPVERVGCWARPFRNPITPDLFKLGANIRNFDVIHLHNEHSFASLVGVLQKKMYNTPFLLTCHGQLKFGQSIKDLIERVYSRTLGCAVLKACDRIITLSDSDRTYVESLGVDRNKISIIPNAIDPKILETGRLQGEECDLITGSTKNNVDKIVLFVGPLIQRKGVEYLLKAIPIVINTVKNEKILFVLTGDGDYLNEAKKIAENGNLHENVIFTGHISFNKLVHLYQMADVFVLPSLSEGLPTSILEAMYFKVPVIATSIPGIIDHFNGHALLVPPKDEVSLAKAIINLLQNDELSVNLSKSANHLVNSRYVWTRVAEAYEKVYGELQQ